MRGHAAGTCSSDKKGRSTHWGDMRWGRVVGTYSRDKITAFAHTWKCTGDMFSGICPRDVCRKVQQVELSLLPVNDLKGSFSNDDGNGNENVVFKIDR